MGKSRIRTRLVAVFLIFLMIFATGTNVSAMQKSDKTEGVKNDSKNSIVLRITNLPENNTVTVNTQLDFEAEVVSDTEGKEKSGEKKEDKDKEDKDKKSKDKKDTGKPEKGIIRWELTEDSAGVETIGTDGTAVPTAAGSFQVRALYFQNDNTYIAWLKNHNIKLIIGCSEWSTIIVEDDLLILPELTLLGDQVIFVQTGTSYTDPGVRAFDEVDGDITDQVETYGNQINMEVPGEYYIYYQVHNSAEMYAFRYRMVVVGELGVNVAPVIALGWIRSESYIGQRPLEYEAVAWDYVDGNITNRIIVGGDPVDLNRAGLYTVTFDVTDKDGNAAVRKFVEVIIQDPENPRDYNAPYITLDGYVYHTLNVGETFEEPGFYAWDDVDGDITAQVVVSSNLDVNKPGVYQINYDVADAAGNVAHAVRIIEIMDMSGPEIILHGDRVMFLTVGEAYQESGATAYDILDGDISEWIQIVGYVDTIQPGMYNLQYSVEDSSGIYAWIMRYIVVSEANTPVNPVIALNGDYIEFENIGTAYTEKGAVAFDDQDGNISAHIIIGGDTVITDAQGIFYVTYDVQDSQGFNALQEERKVVVIDWSNPIDYIDPIITMNGSWYVSVNAGGPYVEEGAAAWDETDGDISGRIEISSNMDVNVPGYYQVSYKVTDATGNKAQLIRLVEVIDGPPSITVVGNPVIFLTIGDTYQEPGVTAYDSKDGDLTSLIQVMGYLDTNYAGTYQLYYQVADSSGNYATAGRTIAVSEANAPVAPVIALNGFYMEMVSVGTPYQELGAIAYDDKEGDISANVIIGGDVVDTSKQGIYYITYNVQDSEGLKAQQVSRKVVVIDYSDPIDYNEPELQLLGDSWMQIGSGDPFVEPGYIATDDRDGDITQLVQVEGVVDTNTVGEYILTYRAKDSAGNEVAQTRVVNVYQKNHQSAQLNGDQVMFLIVEEEFIDPMATVISSTGEDLSSQVIVDGIVDIHTPGTYYLNYKTDHLLGGYYYLNRIVIVSEEGAAVAPVICLDYISTTALVGMDLTLPKYWAYDDREGNITDRVVVGGDTPDFHTIGSYFITYNVSDLEGNAAEQRTVTINIVESYE